jgi:uncharacterized protein HemX
MNDHAKTIREQQHAQENAVIEALEQRGAPFLWAWIFAMCIAAGVGLWNGYQKLVETEEQVKALSARYVELQQQNEAFVQCLNGRPIALGNEVLRCRIKKQEVQL